MNEVKASRYRFLGSPRWIVGHVIVAALCVSMIWLGFWQLGRLDDKKQFRAEVRAKVANPPAPLADLDLTTADRYRPVTATGVFDDENTVLVANRGFKGQSGYEVLTPLLLTGDTTRDSASNTTSDTAGASANPGAPATVVIDRGWIPLSNVVATLPVIPAAPLGTVTVTGFLDTFERDSVVLDAGPPAVVTKIAAEHFARAPALAPLVVQLTGLAPAAADGQPFPQELPDISLGPHLSYALQWFVFTAMLLGMWPLLIRRAAQVRERRLRGGDTATPGLRPPEVPCGRTTDVPARVGPPAG